MNLNFTSRVKAATLGAATAALLVMQGSLYADPSRSDFVQITGSSDITWELTKNVNYYQLMLKVAGPNDFSYEAGFQGVPYLDGPLEDGLYKYELYVMPYGHASALASGMAAPASRSDRGASDENGRSLSASRYAAASTAQSGRHQFGAFSIANGVLVDPTLTEE